MIENEQDPIFDKRRPVYGKDYDRGWVGFNHSTSWMSKVIGSDGHYRRKSSIVISHAFIVIGEDLCVEAAFRKGVLISSMTAQYFERPERYVVFRKPKNLTPELADEICRLARREVGTRFDNGLVVAHTLNDNFIAWIANKLTGGAVEAIAEAQLDQEDAWICSELTAYVLDQTPQFHGVGNLEQGATMLTPQELFENDEIFEPLPQPDGSFKGARETQFEIVYEDDAGRPND
ncbi:MAG TPA: hypothetical protein VGN57_15375 [Pirellulaceae bacterium]|jgi:hypothetical protein|nr:hypothetical protein [Pirellulaceae bacterium]